MSASFASALFSFPCFNPLDWPAMSEALSPRRAESNGSRGRARTYNHTVNSRVLYH